MGPLEGTDGGPCLKKNGTVNCYIKVVKIAGLDIISRAVAEKRPV